MGSTIIDTGLSRFGWSLDSHGTFPYQPSVASSAPSSQDSVFSVVSSAKSSAASSISDDFRLSQEEIRDRCSQPYIRQQTKIRQAIAQEQAKLHSLRHEQYAQQSSQLPVCENVTFVPSNQRQHPRRSSLARHQKPPPLVRQSERKYNFVDNLVGKCNRL
jgi:PHO85 cyclin-5